MPVIHSLYREPGHVVVHEATCDRCGQCVKICPTATLTADPEGRVRINEASQLGCIACGHCMMVCPNGSVTVNGRDLTPQDLRPLPPRASRATADALEALMQSRRSVRRFTQRLVTATELDRIVQMAASAPMGVPPWDVGCAIVQAPDAVAALAREVVRGYGTILKLLRPWVLAVARPFLHRAIYEQMTTFILPLAREYTQAQSEGHDAVFYGAPAVLIFHHSAYAQATDAMIACTYAMLAAESLGLGTTMIGGAPPILQRRRDLCANLGIPPGNTPSIALIVGHPAVQFRQTVKRRFSSVN